MDYPALELENKTTAEALHNIGQLREWSAPYKLELVRIDGQYHDLDQIELALKQGGRPDAILYLIRKGRSESMKITNHRKTVVPSKLSRQERRHLDRKTKKR